MLSEKVLYIADNDLKKKNGHGQIIRMHNKMLKEIFGDRLVSVFLYGDCINYDSENHNWFLPNSSRLSRVVSRMMGYPHFLSLKARNTILELIQKYKIKIVYIDNSVSGSLIRDIKNLSREIKVTVYFPDIEKILMKEWGKNASLSERISYNVLIRNEKLTVKFSDVNLVLNERDAKLFYNSYGKQPDYVIPIAVPEVNDIKFDVIHTRRAKLKIVFVGVDYSPNVCGMQWFIDNVVLKLKIDFELDIVGYGMERYSGRWNYSNVRVVGTVDDLSKYYRDADVIIAPIFQGGGMKVKTAEAFSYGKKFIGTPESLEGYWKDVPKEIKNDGIYLCNDVPEFFNVINTLYDSEFYINDKRIYDWMIGRYSYSAVKKRYMQVFSVE